jgi:hypothetical protein
LKHELPPKGSFLEPLNFRPSTPKYHPDFTRFFNDLAQEFKRWFYISLSPYPLVSVKQFKEIKMRNLGMRLRVGNLKSEKVGVIASSGFKVNSGDFNGYVVLTDRYGYEVWDDTAIVILPDDFLGQATDK